MRSTDQIADKISKYFRDKPVLKAYLFGSRTKSSANSGRDIDILIELDDSKTVGLEFIQMQLDLENILNQKVDLLTEKALSKYIKPEVDKEKKLIYEK